MKTINQEIVNFFKRQRYTIVSTVDRKSNIPHNSCKGIVKIDKRGIIYLMDLYRWRTYANLSKNPNISVTAVDEHGFKGWCLKGKAKIMPRDKLGKDVIRAWEAKISSRITHRLVKNIKAERGHQRHPEAQLPRPEYMIVMTVEEIVNLIPHHVR
ncbi:MAG: pyridoxamine 5'-phosphate oxidase family protein [Candidatus Omnitrophica bacterium]|nr:pyridoxamine 5'-phosphate oxidase family protein [Candidatus Omnitrophota bacterium]